MPAVNQGVPQSTVAIADKQGYVSMSWYTFFISLWQRSGGGSGGGGALAAGSLSAYAGASAPSGWLFCNGAAVSRTVYAGLFAAIGVTWGPGDGLTTFNLPDLRGRFPMGASGAHALASNGGAESLNLSVGQLPAHSHAVTDPGHTHSALVASSTNTAGAAAGTGTAGLTGSSATGISIDNTGNGDPVPILNPFAAVNWIIST